MLQQQQQRSSGSSLQQEQGSRKAMFDTVFFRFQATR